MPAVRSVIASLVWASTLGAGQTPRVPEPESALRLPFAPSTPAALRTAWLDFHSSRLCQEIDAVFVFHERGLEVWCQAESAKSLERLKRITSALPSAFRVELYATHPQPERDRQEDREPPPGLWNNQELRDYLGSPRKEVPPRGSTSLAGFDDAVFTLKHRIRMFADQTLELGRRLDRYAKDLQELSAVAYDPGCAEQHRARARTLCLTHAAAIDECASKLNQNLRGALPPPGKRQRTHDEDRASPAPLSTREMAAEIAREARKVTQKIQRFVYPEQFTVGIDDLREPGLLESLAVLRRMTADLQQKLKKN